MAEPLHIENNIHLEKLMSTNKDMDNAMRDAVAQVLRAARRDVTSKVRDAMHSDPKGTYRAVRTTLYTQLAGGNINILNKRRSSGRGGNTGVSRRGRMARTEQIMSYDGKDRQFILRFVSSGTKPRVTTHMNGHTILRTEKVKGYTYKSGKIGGRGAILGTDFFGPAAQAAIEKAGKELAVLFEQIYKQQINK